MEVARLLATMENMALLDLSDELASMILNSEEAQNYKLAKEALLNDATSQKNIRQFIRIKEQYEEVQRFGRYHPDYKEVTRKTRAYKREVDMDQMWQLFAGQRWIYNLSWTKSACFSQVQFQRISKYQLVIRFLKQNLLVLQVDVAAGEAAVVQRKAYPKKKGLKQWKMIDKLSSFG